MIRHARPAASAFAADDTLLLIADGKFYVVKVAPNATVQPVPNADGHVNAANLVAIYQVCTHLGCLVPYTSPRSALSARATARPSSATASTCAGRRRAAWISFLCRW